MSLVRRAPVIGFVLTGGDPLGMDNIFLADLRADEILEGLDPLTAAEQVIYDQAHAAISGDVLAAYNDPFAQTRPEAYKEIRDWAQQEIDFLRMGAAPEIDDGTESDPVSTEEAIAFIAQDPDGRVRITGAPPPQLPCRVGPYDSTQCSPAQRHHIVPDYTKRYGPGRSNANRIPGMPSVGRGWVICMAGNARTPGTPHNRAQTITDNLNNASAASGTPLGTISVRQAMINGAIGSISARPECATVIVGAVNAEFAGISGNRLMNGLSRTTSLSPEARAALVAGQ